MTTPCPNSTTIIFPAVTVPLSEIAEPLPPDVLCGRGGTAQRHAGNLHYRTLVNSNKPYYCTCPKTEKLRISRSIVASVRHSNGRFLERSVDGLYYDIGDKKAVEKTSQALREGQPKLRKRIQELQEESGAADVPGAQVVEGIVESHPNGPCSTADVGDLDLNVQAAAAGYRSPLLGEGGIAAAVFVPKGGERPAANAVAAVQNVGVSVEQAYGTLPSKAAGSAAGTPTSIGFSAANTATRDLMAGVTDGGTGGGGGGGGIELSKESIRNLMAEAATGTYGAVPTTTVSSSVSPTSMSTTTPMTAMQLELKRRQEELREQQRQYEERERARMMGQYQLGVDDLEPAPLENIAVGVGNAIGKGEGGLRIDVGASPTNAGNGNNVNADGSGMFADISPIALPNGDGGKRPSLEGFRPPSFKTRSIAEEIQYQREELRRMQEEAQAQELQLQRERQRYLLQQQQQQQQAQLAGQQPNPPGQTQQTSNKTLSQISLMSTFSAIGDSAMSLGMLVSDREVGDPSAGAGGTGAAAAAAAASPTTNSPAALTAAARAQAPQSSVVQQESPALAAMASAAVQPITAETVSHVHPNPNAGPVSIWDAGESNRDLATLVADNASIPKEKILGYMADDHPDQPPDFHEPLQPEQKGRRQIRRKSSVESRRKIFASMKRPVAEDPRRPSTVEAESGNTMSSVSTDTLGSKQKSASAKAGSDSGSDIWRSEEIRASAMAASAAAAGGSSPAAAGGASESKKSVMSVDERSKASGLSGLSMMSMISDLGSQFSLLDVEMDRSTAAGLMSSAQVGQAQASAGFGGQQQQPTNQQSPSSQQNQEEMEASQYLVSVSEGLLDSSPDRTGRKSSSKKEDDEDYSYLDLQL